MYHGSHQERKFMSWKDDSVTAPALPSGLHHPPRRVHTEDRDHEHGGVNQDHGGAEHQEHDDGVDLFDDSNLRVRVYTCARTYRKQPVPLRTT